MEKDTLRKIGTISRALDSIANIEFKQIKLTRGQYLYLVRIYENPGMISDRIAEILSVDRTTAARSIQKLERQELVVKKSDPNNKKIRHLFVTEKGKELAQVIEKENSFSNQMTIRGLDQSERKQLNKLLSKVEQNVDQNWHFVKNGGKREY